MKEPALWCTAKAAACDASVLYGCWFVSHLLCFQGGSLLGLGRVSEDGRSAWAVLPMSGTEKAPGRWLWPVVAIWEWEVYGKISLSFPVFVTLTSK